VLIAAAKAGERQGGGKIRIMTRGSRLIAVQRQRFFAMNKGFDGEPNSLYNHAFSRTVCGKMNSE